MRVTARGVQRRALGRGFVLEAMEGPGLALVQLDDDLCLAKKSNFRHLSDSNVADARAAKKSRLGECLRNY